MIARHVLFTLILGFLGHVGQLFLCQSSSVFAQKPSIRANSDAAGESAPGFVSTQYIPDDAVALVYLSPAELISNESLQLFPIEVFRVQAIEQMGVDPAAIESLKFIIGLTADGQPQAGLIMKLTGKVDIGRMAIGLWSDGVARQEGEYSIYQVETPIGTALCQVDDETIYAGMLEYLDDVVTANDGSGPLPSLLKKTPSRPGFNAIIAMESIRPMVSVVAMQQADSLAPQLQPLAQIPELTEAIKIHLNLEGFVGDFALTFLGTDEGSTKRIDSILKESLVAARELAIAEVKRTLISSNQSDAMQEAAEQYAQRIGDLIVSTMTPERTANEVVLSANSQIGIASTGVLAGMLLPAIQSARNAARRMTSSNNLKMIGLALHNYHSAYRKLPNSAITDPDGKPLLSWRVAILPFIEEQELYQKFHLDEPWDSENNLPLSKKLPAVYQARGIKLPEGKTIYQALVGENIGFKPLVDTRFRDFLDGLSNSLLVVETKPEAAVIWSKPEDVEIDMDDPLANLKGTPNKGFHVLLGDGAVRFMSDNVDTDLMKALMTRANKELIENW